METNEEIFIGTINRLFPYNITSYITSLYKNLIKLRDLSILDKVDISDLDNTLNDICLIDSYTDSELQYIIRDILFKQTLTILRDNGLDLVGDEEIANLKTLSDVLNAIIMYLNDESAKPFNLDIVEDDYLYENMADIIAMYSTMNTIETRELINDVEPRFCSKMNLCILNRQEKEDEEYRFDLAGRVTAKDPIIIGTKLVSDLINGNLNGLELNLKDDQKIVLKYLNNSTTKSESVNELLAYLYIIGVSKSDYKKYLDDNLKYENITFIKSSNDKKFEYLQLLENRIK